MVYYLAGSYHALRGGGVLLGILGGGVQRGSPNPEPISDEKM